MGLISEDAPDHEGYVSNVFADGERASWTGGRGCGVWPGGDIKREEVRPFADIVAWRVDCACGWSGPLHPLTAERPEDIDERWNEPQGDREEALLDEWRHHIAPLRRTSAVRELSERLASIQAELTAAVREARAQGASWGDLGPALGVTRQAAQQRYGGH